MKYSLFFLALLLLWSALLVNGFLKQWQCDDLDRKIKHKTSQLDQLSSRLTEPDPQWLETLRQEIRSYRPIQDHLVNAFEANGMEPLDLASVSTELAVVGRIPHTFGLETVQPDKFKIRIPSDRKVEIRADFSYGNSPSRRSTRAFTLPTGEYEIQITTQNEHKNAPYSSNIIVDIDNLEPVRWEFDLDFRPSHCSSTYIEHFDLFWTQVVDSTLVAPPRLFSELHSCPKTDECVEIVVSLFDVTDYAQTVDE